MYYYSESYQYYLNPTLIIAAVVPAFLLLLYVYKADRLEKEPKKLLFGLILQGIISTSLAAFTERIGVRVLAYFMPTDGLPFLIAFNFLVVGLSEEGFKYLLLRQRTWNSPHFNCSFDGVVYAVFVSLGFALWENIDYVAMYGFETAMIRAVTAIPGHACFGVFMGAWYGLAKSHERQGRLSEKQTSLKCALICPMLLHGLYDFIAEIDATEPALYFIGFILILFVVAYRMIRKLSRQDHYL